MVNKGKKWFSLGIAFLIVSIFTVHTYGEEGQVKTENEEVLTEPAISSAEFKTNRFTKPNATEPKVEAQKIEEKYKLMTENDSAELYVNEDDLSIKIKDKRSGYVWSTTPSEEDVKESNLNGEWESNVNSPVIVQYLSKEAKVQSGSLLSLGGQVSQFQKLSDGFHATLSFDAIATTFDFIVRLEEDSIVVTIPEESIKELGEVKLYSIQAYSFLGSVKDANTPGYMFIPDGSGALIRFQEKNPHYEDPFASYIYGNDPSIYSRNNQSVPPQPISLPVFGVVHGEDQNGFIAVVEDGKYDAEILAYPSGITTNLNWVTTRFTVRHRYFQPTSKNMGGINTYQEDRLESDKQIRYLFLTGEDANYTGMAKKYREYLVKNDILQEKDNEKEDVPLHIEVLGADMKPGLIFNRVVNMTSFEQVQTIIEALEGKSIDNIVTVLQGWSKGGLYGRNPTKFPMEKSIGGESEFKRLQEFLDKRDLPIYLATDYTNGFEKAKQFNPRVDAVRMITDQVYTYKLGNFFTNSRIRNIDVYKMNPGKALEIANQDIKEFANLGVSEIAVTELGRQIFSDHNDKQRFSREDTAEEYKKIADLFKKELGKVALYAPNDYALPYANHYFDTPMGSSQYMYTTDTVPFLQTVLHGFIDYYVSPINFEANPHEQVLRMIEYGAYPSYFLTHSPTYDLKDTASSHIFTSKYEDWIDNIGSTYETINEALSSVQSATIESRVVLDWGVVHVQYSNGVEIFVNYTENDYQFEGLTIAARDYFVQGGEE